MNIEQFPKNEEGVDTVEEIQVDPHTYSVIPEALDLSIVKKDGATERKRYVKGEKYQNNEDGERYFKKMYLAGRKEDHQKEHFVSLLIKGIFHSSEMVKIGEEDYFSRQINLDNTQEAQPFEKEAEIFLLKSVLGDFDKRITPEGYRSHNIDEDGNRFSLYDFTYSFSSNEFNEMHKGSRNSRKIFDEFCEEHAFSKEDVRDFSEQILHKLNALEEAVNDKVFISALIEKTGFEPREGTVELTDTQKAIQKIRKYLISEKSSQTSENIKIGKIKDLLLKPIHTLRKVIRSELGK